MKTLKVTKKDKEKIVDAIVSDCMARGLCKEATEEDKREIMENLEGSYLVKFDYQTGCPGYVGPLILLVADGAPCYHTLFKEGADGKLETVEREVC